MAVIRYKNQSNYAFMIWMGSHPNSGHALDEERFYRFAKTVAVYRNKKWLDQDFFRKSVLEHPTYLDEEKIDKYWRKLLELVAFHKVGPIPTVGHGGEDRDHGLYQMGVDKGRMYQVKISKAEYYKGGATKETMRNAEYFGL
jgi:hypothetical protein